MQSSDQKEAVMNQDLAPPLRVENFPDHQVITQPNPLRGAVHASEGGGVEDPIARAERALASLCGEFRRWMAEECARLTTAHHAVRTHGYSDDTAMEMLYAAHDIRGHALTYGYAAAADIADGLCRLMEFGDTQDAAVADLIERHVEAISAVVRATDAHAGGSMANELVERLRFFTEQHIESREFAEAESPPLAPN